MIEPYILPSDVEAARGHILEMASRVEALLPRIEAAQGIHQEEALAKLANLYLRMAHDLMKVADLHGEMIEDPRILALRRAMKPYRGL
jgi:hypothetical protein